ncbi:MAG: NADH-quinone oxidoreductase subunit M [Flavobacteriia bacterium]|nr:NADH-quinone oxidoreductase subunit M [Flavobacteriia bacterium]
MELLVIPLVLAIISGFATKQLLKYLALFGTLLTFLLIAYRSWEYFGSSELVTLYSLNASSAFKCSFHLAYDGITLLMLLLNGIIFPLLVLAYYHTKWINNNRFVSMMFLMQFALIGVFLSMDVLLFYVFWEITLIPIFLIAYWFGSGERKKALIKFFIFTFVGSLAMLFSIIYLGSFTNSFNYSDVVSLGLTKEVAVWVMFGFLIAFAVKAPIFPLHSWQPDTYVSSPSPGTILLSALMLKMALYGMVRWMIPLAPEAIEVFRYPVIILSIIGIIYAAIIAIRLDDIKRVFAYASISHVGLIAGGIMIFTKDSLYASFLQMLNHGLIALALFMSAGILEERLQTRSLAQMGGVAKLAPRFAMFFAIIAFASVSVPFSMGFVGEFLLLKEIYSFSWISGLLAGTTLILGAIYTLRAYQLSMFSAPKISEFKDLHFNEWLVYIKISILLVVLGLFPHFIFDLVGPSIDKLLDSVFTINLLK